MRDERQKQIEYRAMSIAGIFLMICVAIAMVYKVIKTDNIGWEFWVFFGALIILSLSKRIFGDIEQPKSIIGKDLPVGNLKEEKKVRKMNYAIESAIFAFAYSMIDILLVILGKEDITDYELTSLFFPNLNNEMTIVLTALISFVVMFVISFVLEYIVGENKVKKYNEMLEKLEED